MPVYHSAFFISLIALFHFYLAIKIIGYRRGKRISLGDGGNENLSYILRAQANLLEYGVPMAMLLLVIELLLIASSRLDGLFGWCWFLLALVFLVGRGLHAWGMMTTRVGKARVFGMHFTLWPLLIAALWALGLSVGL